MTAERDESGSGIDDAKRLVDQAVSCVTAALNCPAHPWHGSDTARKWLMDAAALRADA